MSTSNAEVHVTDRHFGQYGTADSPASCHATAVDAQRAMRLAAIAADASATTAISLSLVWRDLTRGTSSLVDAFFSEDNCYLVLGLKTEGVPIEGQRLEILEAMLGGLCQNNIAIDLAVSPSTVAMHCARAFTSLGLDCKPSRAHPLLMLAARAFNQGAVVVARRSTLVGHDDRELRVIGMRRSDGRMVSLLPSAELAVVRGLVEGLTYADLAQQRGTSVRTIANQISSVFRRLKVSGRNELVQLLFFDKAPCSQTPGARRETLIPPAVSDVALRSARDETRRSA